jgi:hypothetical protein
LAGCSKSLEERQIEEISISEEERALLEYCYCNSEFSIDEINKNLIGEWSLVGYACGFCAPHDAPQARITFETASGVLFSNEGTEQEEIVQFDYEVKELFNNILRLMQMQTEPYRHELAFNYFCGEYIAFDGRAVDNIMMIYQKN